MVVWFWAVTWQNWYVEVQGYKETERAGERNQQKVDHHSGDAGGKKRKKGVAKRGNQVEFKEFGVEEQEIMVSEHTS